jgi:hypothetical protein
MRSNVIGNEHNASQLEYGYRVAWIKNATIIEKPVNFEFSSCL